MMKKIIMKTVPRSTPEKMHIESLERSRKVLRAFQTDNRIQDTNLKSTYKIISGRNIKSTVTKAEVKIALYRQKHGLL